MSDTYSFDYEIMQLPDTEGIPCVLSNVTTELSDYKDALLVSPRCLLGWHKSRLGFATPGIGEVSLGPLGNAHHNKPCKQCD